MLLELLFILIALSSLAFLYIGSGKNINISVLFIWQILVGIVAYNGYFLNYPTSFPFTMLITLGLSFWLISRININAINQKYLLLLHVHRIPVEYALLLLYLKSKIPVEMTFLGWNFDILIGLTALFIFIYQWLFTVAVPRKVFILWNIVGLGFLFFIVSIAVLSSPIPVQKFGIGRSNIAVLAFPFYLLPTCIVPTVLISHSLF
ncbi:hypothetical protein OWR28_14875 [Chryseobacterium sp. 1B4]